MRFFYRNNSVTDIFVSGVGSMVAPLINFAAIPIVLRIYSPAEYGNWVLIMSFAILLGNVSTLRYERALVLAEDDKETGQILGLCLLLIVLIAGFAFVGILASPWWVGFIPSLAEVQSHLWAVPLLTGLIGLSWVGRSLCTRHRAFIYNSLSFIVFASFTNAGQILAPKFGLSGSFGLLVGSIAGWTGSTLVVLLGSLLNSNKDVWLGLISLKFIDRAMVYINFPRFSVPYTFVGTLRLEGVKLLFGVYGNSALVGDFSFAQRLTNFPVTVFCGGIRPVLFQKAARPKESIELEIFIRRVMFSLVLIIVPLAVLFEIQAEIIFDFFVGPKWSGSVAYARILVLPAMGMIFASWLDRMFDVKGRQGLALVLQIVFTVLGLACFSVGLLLLDNPLLAVFSQGFVTFLYFSLTGFVAYRICEFPISKLRGLLYFPFILILLVVGSWLLFGDFLGVWTSLGIGIATAWLFGIAYLRHTLNWSI